MELALLVYLIGVLPSIEEFMGFLVFICVASIELFLFINLIMERNPIKEIANYKWFSGIILGMFFMASAVIIAIPEEKTMYMMAGAYATQQVYESDEAKKIGAKLNTLIDKKMQEYIDATDDKNQKDCRKSS